MPSHRWRIAALALAVCTTLATFTVGAITVTASPVVLNPPAGGEMAQTAKSVECTISDALTAHERCAFVREHCTERTSQIDYLDFYYCTFGEAHLQPMATFILTIQLVFLFIFLGTASGDYFCPNLTTLAEAMRMPPDVAGVCAAKGVATLLALGNSAPDLVSSLVAFHSADDAVDMAIGELIGAGLFVGTVVVGLVVLCGRPAPGATKPLTYIRLRGDIFLRDAGFLLVAVIILGFIVIGGSFVWWEGIIMLALYAFYVAFVCWSGIRYRRRTYSLAVSIRCPSECATRRVSNATAVHSPALSVNGDGCFGVPRPMVATLDDTHAETCIRNAANVHIAARARKQITCPTCRTLLSRSNDDAIASGTAGRGAFALAYVRAKSSRVAFVVRTLGLHLFPIFNRWKSLSVPGKIQYVMSTPAYFFLALTVPVVVPLEEDSEVCVPHDDDAVPLFPEEETCSRWPGDDLDPSVVDEEEVLLFGDRKHARNTQDPADSTRNHTHCHRNGGLESRQQSSRDSFCTRCHPESVDEMPALADLDDERWPLLPATLVQNVADACAEVEWHHRWIVVVQSFLAPIFIVFAVGAFMTNLSVSSGGWFPGYMLGVVLGLVLALAMALYVRPDRHRSRVAAALVNDGEDTRVEVPWRTPFVALFGFVVGIVVCVWPSWMWMGGAIQPMLTSYIQWIFFIANELVGLLKSVGKILRISDSILGLTVLALGNSIGDAVSNVTMARLGYPTMSISACFAGPLINLLITLGVSGILGMGKAPIMLSRDVEVVFIYSGLLFMVIITLFVVLARKFRLHRSMGYVLLILYAVVFGITVMLDRIK